jgi:hypothetical protein
VTDAPAPVAFLSITPLRRGGFHDHVRHLLQPDLDDVGAGRFQHRPRRQFSDSDFFNDSFQALWNSGSDSSGNVFRDDLGTISGGGSPCGARGGWWRRTSVGS